MKLHKQVKVYKRLTTVLSIIVIGLLGAIVTIITLHRLEISVLHTSISSINNTLENSMILKLDQSCYEYFHKDANLKIEGGE